MTPDIDDTGHLTAPMEEVVRSVTPSHGELQPRDNRQVGHAWFRSAEVFVPIAQITGAFAVVISLIFVGLQIRQNTTAIRSGNEQSSLSLSHNWDQWLRDPEFASSYAAGLSDYATLTPAQKLRFDTYVVQGLTIWEFAFYRHADNAMESEIWQGWDRYFSSQVRQPSWTLVWQSTRDWYGDAFREHVAAHIR